MRSTRCGQTPRASAASPSGGSRTSKFREAGSPRFYAWRDATPLAVETGAEDEGRRLEPLALGHSMAGKAKMLHSVGRGTVTLPADRDTRIGIGTEPPGGRATIGRKAGAPAACTLV